MFAWFWCTLLKHLGIMLPKQQSLTSLQVRQWLDEDCSKN